MVLWLFPVFYLTSRVDSLNMKLVGNWPFGSPYVLSYDVSRKALFCGSGGGVFILDAQDSSELQEISEISTPGFLHGMFYDSLTKRLYLALDDRGIEVWDLSDLYAPQKIVTHPTGGKARDVYLVGNYLYVAADTYGLQIFTVSDTGLLSEIGRCNTPGRAYKVCVSGTYAYIADYGKGMRIIDISTPENPQEVGYYFVTIDPACDLVVKDTLAYLILKDNKLSILNVSDPSNPVAVGSYSTPFPFSVEVIDSFAYVGDEGALTSLYILNVSTPSNPILVSEVDAYSPVYDVKKVGNILYVAAGNYGILVFNATDISNLEEINYFPAGGTAYNVFVQGDFAYLACDKWLQIIDISNLSSPCRVGYFPASSGIHAVWCVGNYAYVGDGGVLRILDISDPTNPIEISSVSAGDIYDVEVHGNYAYAAGWGKGLRIIDVADPLNPYVASICTTYYSLKLSIQDTYAFLAEGLYGFSIVDISDPLNPEMVSQRYVSGWGTDISVYGLYAYLMTGGDGLYIWNISDIFHPQKVGSCNTYNSGYHVYTAGSYSCVTNDSGIQVVDVSDPYNPSIVGYYFTPTHPWGLLLRNSYIYVAAGNIGLQIYQTFFEGLEENEHIVDENLVVLNSVVDICIPENRKALQFYLYDVVGRDVSENIEKIEYKNRRIKILLKPIPLGVYFLRMEHAEYRRTIKLLMLK
ncbi:hypothetical protein DRQ18_05110 [bacterium]|nr:MAG: hypothetical protein DRQ18_05110 [bacterium]